MEKKESFEAWCKEDLGSERLFNICWKKYREYLDEGVFNASSDPKHVILCLKNIAFDKMNNPRSPFYKGSNL